MIFGVDQERVRHILLPDGWHEVEEESFTLWSDEEFFFIDALDAAYLTAGRTSAIIAIRYQE